MAATARRWGAAMVLGSLLGAIAVWWAGAVLDAPLTGQPWRFGTWAALWGVVAFLLGAAAGARGTVGLVVLSLVTGLLATATWWFVVMFRAPVWSLEGAWLYPLAIASTVVAVWAARRAG